MELKKIVFHPTWVQNNDGFYYANDYTLVKLDTPVTNVDPVPMYTTADEEIGSVTWYVGYGDYSATAGQDPDAYSKRHAIENILDRKVTDIETSIGGVTYVGGILATDFDDPTGQSNTLGDAYVGDDEQTLGAGTSDSMPLTYEGTTVQGDSGGPLFVLDNGTWKVAGVLSGGATDPVVNHVDSGYGDISLFMRVSTQIEWINSVIEAN